MNEAQVARFLAEVRDKTALLSRIDFGDVLAGCSVEECAMNGLQQELMRMSGTAHYLLERLEGKTDEADGDDESN